MTIGLSLEAQVDEWLDRAEHLHDLRDETPWWRPFKRWRLTSAHLTAVSEIERLERRRIGL